MNNAQVISELSKFDSNLPVMINCDHGQTPESIFCIQKFYRLIGSDQGIPTPYGKFDQTIYGTYEDMIQYYEESDLEEFIMIN